MALANTLTLFLLATSAVVLVYLMAYAAILYWQIRRKQVRPDWRISVLFYAGILFVALANLATSAADLWNVETREAGLAFGLLALVFFVLGFRARARTAQPVEKR